MHHFFSGLLRAYGEHILLNICYFQKTSQGQCFTSEGINTQSQRPNSWNNKKCMYRELSKFIYTSSTWMFKAISIHPSFGELKLQLGTQGKQYDQFVSNLVPKILLLQPFSSFSQFDPCAMIIRKSCLARRLCFPGPKLHTFPHFTVVITILSASDVLLIPES